MHNAVVDILYDDPVAFSSEFIHFIGSAPDQQNIADPQTDIEDFLFCDMQAAALHRDDVQILISEQIGFTEFLGEQFRLRGDDQLQYQTLLRAAEMELLFGQGQVDGLIVDDIHQGIGAIP